MLAAGCWTRARARLFLSALPVLATAVFVVSAPGAVAVLQASKTDALQVDVNGNSQADPGDTLRYTITITNSGSGDATNSVFNDSIDAGTTFVPGSLQATPIARDDSYSTVGNVPLTVAAAGVLANDADPDGSGGLSVSASPATSANGGNLSVAANGGFTYNPPAGFSGTDTFTYTVTDGESNTDSATASITVGPVVWFINNAVGGPGDGRFTSPFSSVANFNSLAADDPGDYIFVYQGSGAYSGAFTLLNTQQLIGHGVGLSISPNLSIAAASRPTIANVALATGNTVRGLNVSVSSGTAVSGASVGALTINNVSATNTAGVGVSLTGGNSSMAVAFDSVSSAGGANGIVLTDNAGSFTDNGGTIDPTTGHGIQVSNTGVGPLNFALRNSTVTGAPAGFNGLDFAIPTSGSLGTVTVTGNTISNNGSAGLRASIQGTGTVARFDIGSNTFTGNNIGVDLATNGTANVKFDVHNNATMNGTSTQVNIAANDVTHNNGVGPTMEGYIRNNNITTSPTGNTFIAVWVVSDGDGNITTDVNNNTINNFGDSGIDVESRGGTGDVNARIANNSATTTATFPLAGLFLRSGNGSVGETSLLCTNLSSNNMNAGAGAVADYYLDRLNPATTVFQLQGLAPSPATPAQAETYVVSTDSSPPATAFAETGSYTAATCATVSFATAAASSSLQARPAAARDAAPVESDAVAASVAPLRTSDVTGVANSTLATPITPVSLGTLNAGQSVTIKFDVTINAGFTGTSVSNQGNVTADGGLDVLTDDPDVGGSTDPTVTPVVQNRDTTTTITSDTPDPSVVGQSVTVHYSTVPAGGSGTPTGNVTVSDGTNSCTGTVAAGQCSLTFTSAGTKSLTATYAGDGTFNGSTSAAEPHQVNKADTTTTITLDAPDPSVVGQSVTVQFGVAPTAPGGGVPAGNVTVSDGTSSCTATVATGQCSITFTSPGAKTLTATYAGNANYNGSTSASVSHAVNKADTATTISSDAPDPSTVGQAVTVQYGVTASAPGAGTPTGNVTVSDGVDSCTGTVAAGQCNITLTSAGNRTLTATYAGDSSFNGSTSAGQPHTVNGVATTTAITSDAPDPSVVGQPVTVQFSVTSGAGTPTGNVTVSDGTISCTATVAAGQCSLTFTAAGARSLTATYTGNGTFAGSTSAAEPHQVNAAGTTTTIGSDAPDPSTVGQAVTVQYTVTVNAPGSGIPTGNVTVSDGVDSCTGTVAAGQCSLTLTTAGIRTLTATYSGNGNFNGSTSAGEPHAVNQSPAITSANHTTFTVGTAGSFTVTTSGFPAPSLSESGTLPAGVTFADNGNGTATLSGTPAAGTGGVYVLTITAGNGVLPNAVQSFTLTVNQAPAITSAATSTFTEEQAGSFTVTTTGFPVPVLSASGALPAGVTFVDNGNGTATLSGTPADGSAASYPLSLTASNGVVPDAVQAFTLVVAPDNHPPTAAVTNGQCSASNAGSGTINLTLADPDGDALTLTLASNSNTTLVPNANIVLGGSGANRTLTVTAAGKKSGSATLTFNLSDGKVTVPLVVTVIVGTVRDDTLTGTSGTDMIFGDGGTNTINGNAGDDLLCGGNANDTLSGGDGNDILGGEKGDDSLNGGAGNDVLRGGNGTDTLTGGAGADFFSGGSGADTAADLNAAEGDTQDGTIP